MFSSVTGVEKVRRREVRKRGRYGHGMVGHLARRGRRPAGSFPLRRANQPDHRDSRLVPGIRPPLRATVAELHGRCGRDRPGIEPA
jgi:hypothetical protein